MTFAQMLMWFLDVRAVLLCVFSLFALRWIFSVKKNLPPGPSGFPIVGSAPAILLGRMLHGLQPYHLFAKYAEKYGPVVHLKLFNKTMIILNDFSSIRDAFQHPNFNDRPKMLFAELTDAYGVSTISGEPWLELRRFCISALRNFGIGKSSFEEKIVIEAEEVVKKMNAYDGKPFDPKAPFANAVANIIYSVIFGKRYNSTDEEFKKLVLINENMKLVGAGAAICVFHFLRHLPFVPFDKIMANFEASRKCMKGIINAHRASFDPDNLEDFTDVYLMEIQQNLAESEGAETAVDQSTPKPGTHMHLNEKNFIGTVENIIVAGSESTATTLEWIVLYMAFYPDVQRRVQAEIDAVVGRERLPRLTDKPELNFTQAVIWEIQRMSCIGPLGIPHCASADTYFRGYLIPKGALLVANFWSVFKDPTVWQDPDQFKPERFLNEDGKAVKPDELIPFSIGRRYCFGEHLAKMELFIFFSYLMHQFTIKKPDNSPPLTLKGKVGLIHSALPFQICAIKRDKNRENGTV